MDLGGGSFVDSGEGQTALLGICYLISSLGLHFKLQCSLFNLGILQSQEAELTTRLGLSVEWPQNLSVGE